MRVVFRADASASMGTGHIMRCLAIANELKKNGAEVSFFCRAHDGHMAEKIKLRGYDARLLAPFSVKVDANDDSPDDIKWLGTTWEQDAEETLQLIGAEKIDWLVVDHYGIDYRWHNSVRAKVDKILVVEDLANRKLDCDMLLDQNYYHNPMSRYEAYVDNHCECFLGPQFAMLRQEFIDVFEHRKMLQRKQLKHVLVFMGGADSSNETMKVLQALDDVVDLDLTVDVLVGASNPRAQEIQTMCEQRAYASFYHNVSNMVELLEQADLAIGTGGVAALERCFLGLPAMVMLTADNQTETTTAMHKDGALLCLGRNTEVGPQRIIDELRHFYNNIDELVGMSTKALQLFDDKKFSGVSDVINKMVQ